MTFLYMIIIIINNGQVIVHWLH